MSGLLRWGRGLVLMLLVFLLLVAWAWVGYLGSDDVTFAIGGYGWLEDFPFVGGHGTIRIGDAGYAELEPYKNASGATTTLADTIFSTVPGAPVFVGKSPHYRAKNAALGIDVDIKGFNALQSTFVFGA